MTRTGPLSGLSLSVNDVLGGRELAQAHRAAGVQLLRADADLRSEAELFAVDETRRCIDENGGGFDFAREPRCGLEIASDDRLAVARAKATDVRDGVIDVGYHRN